MATIGIDFGTTNCSAAVYRQGTVEMIPLEGGRPVLPSTICFTRSGEIHFGRAAIERYLDLTRDTPIRYRFTDLRAITSVYAAEMAESPLIKSEHALVVVADVEDEDDAEKPARLFQSIKSALRDPGFNGTTVYGRYYATEELIGLVLRHIRERAEEYLGEPVTAAVIGCPVTYATAEAATSEEEPSGSEAESRVTPDDDVDRTAHERMLAAARLAGLVEAALEYEPVAAARYLYAGLPRDARAGGYNLVFDFGGGTLDLAVGRVTGAGAVEIVATHGITVGGDDLDSAIMQHALLQLFGLGTTLGPKELPFPPNLLTPLLHWQTIPVLARPANAAHLAAIKRQSNAPETVENLQTLTRQGLGFRLFQAIEAAKIRLSTETATHIVMVTPYLRVEERITRGGFVAAIADHLVTIEHGVEAALAEAGLTRDAIDLVLMTGGSSLVPVVQGRLRSLFGVERVHLADPFTSIVAGLALVAAEDDICAPVADVVPGATRARLAAEAVTIGETVAFRRGHQTVEGLVVRRAGGVHDAVLVIEFWDTEIEQFVSTMRHETKVRRVKVPR